jgi:hemerythrin
MSLIEWQDEFSVGDASVDLEHRELIELINNVHALAGDNASADTIVSMLGEIFAQISAHFALEEKFMRDSRYPLLNEHKGDHEDLLDELRDIMDNVDADGGYDEQRLSGDLQHWFTEHFRTHDAKLHRHGH